MKYIEAVIGLSSALMSVISLIAIAIVLINPNKTILLKWTKLTNHRRTYGCTFFLCTCVFFLFLLIFIAVPDARFLAICFMLLTAIGIYSMSRVLATGIIPSKAHIAKHSNIKIGPDGMVEQQQPIGKKGKIIKYAFIAVGCIFIFIIIMGSFMPKDNNAPIPHATTPAQEQTNKDDLQVKVKPEAEIPEKIGEVGVDFSDDDTAIGALIFSRMYVKEHLKSPKTADFASFTASHCTKLTDGKTYKIASYVDSQNGFGAMIRTRYYVKLIKTGPENIDWKVLDFQYGE